MQHMVESPSDSEPTRDVELAPSWGSDLPLVREKLLDRSSNETVATGHEESPAS